jgi:DNA-directed RNA polymerase subunit M/transcription elongation factor TFIIS
VQGVERLNWSAYLPLIKPQLKYKKEETMNRKFFLNGEYAIVRTLPRTPRLYVESTSFIFEKINRHYQNVDRGADYESFVLRQFFHGKFYKVHADGSRGNVSPQQNWLLSEEYERIHYERVDEGHILVCNCSYPYFSSTIISGEWDDVPHRAGEQPVTCLKDDSARAINFCPNCNARLFHGQSSDEAVVNTQNNGADFAEGEYLVIQTYPRDKSLHYLLRTFNYQKACDRMLVENFGSDFAAFALRIASCGILYKVEANGTKGTISKEQDWKIEPSYLQANRDQDNEGQILVCNCSYPYYAPILIESSHHNDRTGCPPLTCLVGDHGRVIVDCPNCNDTLFWEEEGDDEEDDTLPPAVCTGCSNYYGQVYNGNKLICAMHPCGIQDEYCPDYAS